MFEIFPSRIPVPPSKSCHLCKYISRQITYMRGLQRYNVSTERYCRAVDSDLMIVQNLSKRCRGCQRLFYLNPPIEHHLDEGFWIMLRTPSCQRAGPLKNYGHSICPAFKLTTATDYVPEIGIPQLCDSFSRPT